MAPDRSATVHPAGVALLQRAVGYTLDTLELVTFEALWSATPCAGWSLAELLAHLDDSVAALQEAAEHGRVDPVRRLRAGGGVDPVADLQQRADRLLRSWTTMPDRSAFLHGPHGLTLNAVAGAGAIEVAVHGWDVARACGEDRPFDAPLAEGLLACAPEWVSPVDRPARFAPPVSIAPGAGTSDRLLAFLGRDTRASLSRQRP